MKKVAIDKIIIYDEWPTIIHSLKFLCYICNFSVFHWSVKIIINNQSITTGNLQPVYQFYSSKSSLMMDLFVKK